MSCTTLRSLLPATACAAGFGNQAYAYLLYQLAHSSPTAPICEDHGGCRGSLRCLKLGPPADQPQFGEDAGKLGGVGAALGDRAMPQKLCTEAALPRARVAPALLCCLLACCRAFLTLDPSSPASLCSLSQWRTCSRCCRRCPTCRLLRWRACPQRPSAPCCRRGRRRSASGATRAALLRGRVARCALHAWQSEWTGGRPVGWCALEMMGPTRVM